MKTVLMILALALAVLLPSAAQAYVGIATRSNSTCAIMQQAYGGYPANQLYCWGSNASCQTGIGSCSGDTIYPTPKSGISGVQQVAKYYEGTCVIQSGALKCWGSNEFGQHGVDPAVYGDTLSARTVIASGVGFIAPGWEHLCAKVGAAVKCWGVNTYGQLGNGTTTNSYTPVTVTGLTGVAGLATAGTTSCARLTNGTVKCWGLHHGNASPAGEVLTPTLVSGLSGVTNIAGGDSHFCVVASGAIKCWGDNMYGQLGTGNFTDSATPVQVATYAGIDWSSGVSFASAGWGETCAVRTDGDMYCWGRNEYGSLGWGLFGTDYPNPGCVASIGGAPTWLVSVGSDTACSLTDGFQDGVPEYYCWGLGDHKQLGANQDGTWPWQPRNVPAFVYFWGGP